jgi:hypothetical protein
MLGTLKQHVIYSSSAFALLGLLLSAIGILLRDGFYLSQRNAEVSCKHRCWRVRRLRIVTWRLAGMPVAIIRADD